MLENLFASPNPKDANRISPSIEKGSVHPDIQIVKLIPPHPLGGKEVFQGHFQHGVFALKQIAKGVELGEYVGEIEMELEKGGEGVYSWRILVNDMIFTIHSRRRANELSFVNDYRGLALMPNVQTTLIVHRGRYYFGYETLRVIEPGEELLIDYGMGALPKNQSP